MNLINELRMLAEDLHVNGYNRYSAAMSKAADELGSLERYRTAYNEWVAKTEWVQADTTLPVKYLGMHRADVLKDMISELEERTRRLESALHRISLCSQNSTSSQRECGRTGEIKMIDINELREAIQTFGSQAINEGDLNELLIRLEAAEKDIALKERIIDSLGAELNAVANECNTPYSFDPTDNGTICVRCLKEKMKPLLQLIQQPLSKVRTLSPEQIERHKLTAGECPSGSEVLLVSSVRRLLGCGIGDEKP